MHFVNKHELLYKGGVVVINIKVYRKQVIQLLDIMIMTFVCLVLFILFPADNGTSTRNIVLILPNLGIMIACTMAFQLLVKTYNSLWRYAESKEYILLFTGVLCGYLSYFLIDLFILKSAISIVFCMSVFSLSFTMMMLMRFVYRQYRNRVMNTNQVNKIYVAIIGAGEAGAYLAEEMRRSTSNYIPFCFFDDDVSKIGKFINNIEVKGPISLMPELIKNTPVFDLVIAMPNSSSEEKQKILSICSKTKCKTRISPDPIQLLDDFNLTKNIREVKIEDLLGRTAVTFEKSSIKSFITGKTVMVTGGGGSIGSELSRQIASFSPKQLIIIDIYENNAYAVQQELQYQYGDQLDLRIEIATVRDAEKIDLLFKRYQPDIVIHAAAHKHVPLMETNPEEAIKNNVFGTYNVVHAADKYHTDTFVLISSDKAVNPTNVMGASKRLCEMVLQSMKSVSKTKYVAVRFGNVLGSNGSVIPLFTKQIQHGGPVTITDKRIIRYFMTITEASQLVLETAAMADSSQIFVLDMGEPVKILDLAENLIRLMGYVPYEEIKIEETGLRPGEKLYEELLMRSEELINTKNDKIFIEQQGEISATEMIDKLELLQHAISTNSVERIVQIMKIAVPTYKSPDEVNSKTIVLDYSDLKEERVLTVSV